MTETYQPNGMFEKYLAECLRHIDLRIDLVRELSERQITALKELFDQRAASGDKALDVAKTGLNEMRGMAMDQQTTFLRRAEYEAKHDAIMTRIAALEKVVAMITGTEQGGDRTWYVIGLGASLLVAIGSLVISLHK